MKFGNGTTYNPLCTTVFVPYVLQDVFTLLNIISSCFILALFALTYSVDPSGWKSIFDPRLAKAQARHGYTELHTPNKLEQWCSVVAITNYLLWL